MPKALFITYDGLTDPLGQSQVLPYVEGLSRNGYTFHILSFEKGERFEKERGVIEKICARAGITWVPLKFHAKPPVLAKVYDRVQMKKMAVRLQQEQHFDVVHCRSYPAAEVGLHLKQKFGTRLLFDMRGFWPDEKRDSGHWNQRRPWYRWMYRHYKKLEQEFLNNADHVISLTDAGRKELARTYGGQYTALSSGKGNGTHLLEEKIDVIPCCADLEHFDYHNIREEDRTALKERLGIGSGQKVLSYSGSLGTWYMMDEMLQFFRVFRERYPDAVFLCLTKEPKSIMDAYVEKNGIDPKSVVTTFANRKDLPLHLSLSDCSIFFIRPTYSKISSSPTKYAELMGLGVPVICNDFGDTGTIVEATGSGVVVKAFTERDYREAVQKAEDLFRIDKAAIRQDAFHYFDLQSAIHKYRQVYSTMLKTASKQE